MRRRAALLLVAAICAACSGAPVTGTGSPAGPSPTPTATPVAPWQPADVAQPSPVLDAPSLSPGYACHPCHYLAENNFLGVSTWPQGFLAVGVQEPPAEAIAMSSTAGQSWQPVAGFVGAETTTAEASATNSGRTVVVGLEHTGATAWAFDGTSWQQAPEQPDLLVDFAAGGMTSVVAYQGGFVAGGYRDDPLHGKASAAAWRSSDGLSWKLDQTGTGVFDGGRIWGMAANASTIVAVGTSGDAVYGPAGAWRWTAATGWQRAQIKPDAGGAMAAVVATSGGFVAVGKNSTDLGAMVWTSPDGLTWTQVADQSTFHYYQLAVRMQSIAVTPAGLVVGGWRSDVGKGSAVTWTSSDGLSWNGPAWEDSFSGGQITGVAVTGRVEVAVGRTGYPDWNRAAAWLGTGQ